MIFLIGFSFLYSGKRDHCRSYGIFNQCRQGPLDMETCAPSVSIIMQWYAGKPKQAGIVARRHLIILGCAECLS
jgi:hypothetical protein